MKKKYISLLLPVLFCFSSGCNNTALDNSTSNSYNSITTSFNSSSSSSSSSIFEGYKDLDVVISNTRYYGLRYPNREDIYIEINLPDLYYITYSNIGYVVIDEDPNYLHSFTTYYEENSETIDLCMDVHGRATIKEDISYLEQRDFIYRIAPYVKDFEKTSESTWELNSTTLCHELSNFFQIKDIKYCNIVEFTIGRDNTLEYLNFYEGEGKTKVKTYSYIFDSLKRDDLKMYDRWVKSGSKVNERLIDYKQLYLKDENTSVSVYNDEVKSFDATVVAKDSEGNIYVARETANKENVGIKVEPNSNSDPVNVGDNVNVKGKIATNAFEVSVVDALVKDSGSDAEYLPIFEEEIAAEFNGGGIYASKFFSAAPYYSGSVYSTYAYVSSMPETLNENKDTVIEVICPEQTNGEDVFHMQVIIPASLDLNTQVKIFSGFKSAGIYGNDGCYEVNLSQFVLRFDVNYYYAVKLLATDTSEVFKKLNTQEKVEKYVGVSDFPVVDNDTIVSYRFGGSSGYYLESSYGFDTNKTQGIYIGYSSITYEELEGFITSLEEFNASLYDIIKDGFSAKHHIYKYNDTIIDFTYTIAQEDSNGTLNIWVYNGELLRTQTIKERLEAEIGSWFNVDNFVQLDGTYDYDYTLFKLYDYANNSYSLDNPLYCVAIDTNELIRDDFNRALIEKGYTQYMQGNIPYSYVSRGQVHSLFTKDGVFLDVACYPTSDYTYYGHSDYQYRLEVLIYKGPNPMKITTYDNLDPLCQLYSQFNSTLTYKPNLPEDAVVEIWKDLGSFKLSPVEYGYGCRDEAFIYTNDVDGCYESIKEGLLDVGYTKTSEREISVSFKKVISGKEYYIFMFKEVEKGYVRFMHDVGGFDWTR